MIGTGLCGSRHVQRGATAVGGARRRFACCAAAAGSGRPQSRPQSRATGSGSAAAAPVRQPQQPQPLSTAKDAARVATYDQLAALVAPPGDASAGAVGLGSTPRGHGLVARRAVRQGATLVAVRQRHTLSVSNFGGRFGRAARADWQAAHWQLPSPLEAYVDLEPNTTLCLVALLLHVTDRRRKSSAGGQAVWPLYHALLPREPESLMHFTPAERRELQCPELEALAKKERSEALAMHRKLCEAGLAASLKRTLWAISLVHSRGFSAEVRGLVLAGVYMVLAGSQLLACFILAPLSLIILALAAAPL